MTVDWTLKTMEFIQDGKQILLQGAVAKQQDKIQELSPEQPQKWLAGNDVSSWYYHREHESICFSSVARQEERRHMAFLY